MTLDATAQISLTVCAIIFTTFIIVPSAFAFYKRIADFWFAALQLSAFMIACFSLLVATVYSAIALFSQHSAINYSLGVLIILLTIAVFYFIYELQQWLWELALFEVFSEAEAKEQ